MKFIAGNSSIESLMHKCEELDSAEEGTKYDLVYSIGLCAGGFVASGDIIESEALNMLMDAHNKNKHKYDDVSSGLDNMIRGFDKGKSKKLVGVDVVDPNREGTLADLYNHVHKTFKVERNQFTGQVEINGVVINDRLINSMLMRLPKVSKDRLITVIDNEDIPMYHPILRAAENYEGDYVGAIDYYCSCGESR